MHNKTMRNVQAVKLPHRKQFCPTTSTQDGRMSKFTTKFSPWFTGLVSQHGQPALLPSLPSIPQRAARKQKQRHLENRRRLPRKMITYIWRKKYTYQTLSTLYGINSCTTRKLIGLMALHPRAPTEDMYWPAPLDMITNVLDELRIGFRLRLIVLSRIFLLIMLGTYRGLRHRQGLPTRGQRTHSNAGSTKLLRAQRKQLPFRPRKSKRHRNSMLHTKTKRSKHKTYKLQSTKYNAYKPQSTKYKNKRPQKLLKNVKKKASSAKKPQKKSSKIKAMYSPFQRIQMESTKRSEPIFNRLTSFQAFASSVPFSVLSSWPSSSDWRATLGPNPTVSCRRC